jgi:hypothetical protein
MNNGDTPASPLPASDLGLGGNDLGLTKREAFAMAAMQGILSNPAYLEALMCHCQERNSTDKEQWVAHKIKSLAYYQADLMTKEQS